MIGLTRSRDDRVIAGVCAGIAHNWGWQPWNVRALFVLSCLLLGLPLLTYLVLRIVIPSE